jgi:ABC-type maltose transport system permease subunit
MVSYSVYPLIWKVKMTFSSETSAEFQRTTFSHIPEYITLNFYVLIRITNRSLYIYEINSTLNVVALELEKGNSGW